MAIRRILQTNRNLQPGRRIRAISVSIGLTRWTEAASKAAFEEARGQAFLCLLRKFR